MITYEEALNNKPIPKPVPTPTQPKPVAKLTSKPNLLVQGMSAVGNVVKRVGSFIGNQPLFKPPGIGTNINPFPQVKIKDAVNKVVAPDSPGRQLIRGNFDKVIPSIRPTLEKVRQPFKESWDITQKMFKEKKKFSQLTPEERNKVIEPAKNLALGTVGGIKAEPKLLTSGNYEKRIIDAVKKAEPIRAEQEALYTAERSRRIGTSIKAREVAGGGEQGYYAQLRKMEGDMPKVQFKGVREQLSQSDIDEGLKKLQRSKNLDEFEKLPAQKGFLKLMGMAGGTVPTEGEIALLSREFSPEFVKAVMDKRPLLEKIGTNIVDTLNVPRSIMSSTDLSAPLRQGAVLAPGHPKEFASAFKNMFGYAFSEKKFIQGGKNILNSPYYEKAKTSNLSFTVPAEGGKVMNEREEAFMSNLATKIPVIGKFIKGSERAYVGFLNDLRFKTFETLTKNAEKFGKADDARFLASLADFINNATGRGNFKNIPLIGKELEAAAPLGNLAFFSPRLIASRVSFFNPVSYVKMDSHVRKEAARTITAFVASGMTIIGLAKLAGAETESDPTSADWGKIKDGNTRYDIWGGFQPYATFIARMILDKQKSTTTGKINKFGEGYKPTTKFDVGLRFLEGKASPLASFGIDALKGRDFEYNKFDLTNKDLFVNPITKRMVPLIFNDLKDNINEYGYFGPIVSMPGFFGVGQSTYEQKPSTGKRSGNRIVPILR